jgi:hypothetical protein
MKHGKKKRNNLSQCLIDIVIFFTSIFLCAIKQNRERVVEFSGFWNFDISRREPSAELKFSGYPTYQ